MQLSPRNPTQFRETFQSLYHRRAHLNPKGCPVELRLRGAFDFFSSQTDVATITDNHYAIGDNRY
jgi:hypothetical protein